MTATAVEHRAAPRERPTRTRVERAVVVGAGSVGRRHLRNLAALGIDAIVLRSGAGRTDDVGGWRSVRRWADVAAFAPEIAIVANPTALHLPAALAAVRAGCHVLVEKPVSHTLDGLDALAAEVEARGLTAIVGYQFRFHPTLALVRDWIVDGWIGEVVFAQAHWGEYLPGWHPGEDYRLGYSARADLGGGVVRTLSHPLDYLRWLLGEVRAVAALSTRRSGLAIDVEDVAAVTLQLASGALGTVTLNYAERPPRHALSIVGTDGTVHWSAADGVARCWRASPEGWTTATPGASFERNALFVAELEHFVACVEGRAEPRCTLADGVRALALSLAALQAGRERRVVDV